MISIPSNAVVALDGPLSPRRFRNRYLLLSDAILVSLSVVIAFLVRFEGIEWPRKHFDIVLLYLATVPLRLLVFYVAGLYRRLWRHASVGEMKQISAAWFVAASVSGAIGFFVLPHLTISGMRAPFSVIFIDALLSGIAVAFPRLMARAALRGRTRRRRSDIDRAALIVGAGATAKMVVQQLFASPSLGLHPVGFVDDDITKRGHTLCGLPILGPVSATRELIERYGIAEVIIAMPSAPGTMVRRVVRMTLDAGVRARTVPSLPEIISHQATSTSLREVQIEDLLRREAIETDMAAVAALVTGETVLVTGAGGSIGSELSRQLGRLAPQRLLLLGHGENSIFDITQQLRRRHPEVEIIPVIADIRDHRRLVSVLRRHRPHAVFHAAAHKHVPLMEENIVEAVTNNVQGTRNLVDAAVDADVEHFVLISTDKAVRPTSIMGATKRLAEQVVQHAAAKHGRNFVAVRFGNVLGSRGSVVPIFLDQIKSGGPVTVTHPEMRRYFMTIPEAVQLVLQAAALRRNGEVFMLDMGEPVKVVDLARDIIRLSGLEVGTDVEIEYTGIRPGEKLYEEMFTSGEEVLRTEHPKILRARDTLFSDATIRHIDSLAKSCDGGAQEEELRQVLESIVPDFRPHGGSSPREHKPQPLVARGTATPLRPA